MARIFNSGAEESSPAEIWTDIDEIGQTLSEILVQKGYAKNSVIYPRTGRSMYALSSQHYLRNDFGADTSKTELYFGFGVNFPTLTYAAHFFQASTDSQGQYANYLSLKLNTDGTVSVTRSNSTIATTSVPVITPATWYYFEVWFKPLNSSGSAVVKIEGAPVIEFSGDTTNDLQLINAYWFAGVSAVAGFSQTYFDDIVVNDTTGTYNTSYPGVIHLLPIHNESDGSYGQWDRAGVDLGSDSANSRNGAFEYSMLQTSSASQLVTFVPEVPVLGTSASITNIIIQSRARVEGGSGSIANLIMSGSSLEASGSHALTSNWFYHQDTWAYNPGTTGSWVESDLASLEIGVTT